MVDFLEHGEIDPLLLADKKGSYPAFLMECDDDYSYRFTANELNAFGYVTSFLANGMRPHELLMLQDLIDSGKTSRDQLQHDLMEYYSVKLTDKDYQSAVRVLHKDFVNSPGDKRKYADLALVDISDPAVECSLDLQSMLRRPEFRNTFQDIVSFGLLRNKKKYSNADQGLVLYEKYSRKDVCRLLDWERDDSSTMYGYRVKYQTCPIFVTYNKEDDISSSTRYEDAFIDQKTFSWMTRSRLTLNSPEVQRIIDSNHEGMTTYLFVKKHDNEGSDFYYMGRTTPVSWRETTITDDKGKALPIVNFTLDLEHPVRDDVYEYFKSNG